MAPTDLRESNIMNVKAIFTAACLLTWIGTTGAADVPGRKFQITGTVDRVDVKKGEIVIGDKLYRLGPNVQVSGDKKHGAQSRTLRHGTKVGANSYQGASNGSPGQYIYEMRVFPDNFDLSKVAAKDN
jgi:hypothetical protein